MARRKHRNIRNTALWNQREHRVSRGTSVTIGVSSVDTGHPISPRSLTAEVSSNRGAALPFLVSVTTAPDDLAQSLRPPQGAIDQAQGTPSTSVSGGGSRRADKLSGH
eukprot:m.9025 g.9025  ORF g.9025 m.9025 type:complete len:108 (-) comp4129_c0_seq2:2516-2839(-)